MLPRPWAGNQRVEFALDPDDANVIYVYINDVGTYRSGDRGVTWAPPTAGSPGTNVGVQAPRDVWSFVVQPGNSNRLVASTSGGIRISSDAGATWSGATPFRFAYWIGFHASQPQRAIAIGLHGEIMRSEDGGATWPFIQDGADTRVYSFSSGAIDPSTPNRLWATSANGPIVSADWGTTFTLRTGDLRMGDVADFATAMDGTTFAAFRMPIGIFRRAGTQWNPLDISTLFAGYSPGVGIQKFAVAPGNSDVLYVSNIDRVFARSLDGGDTWVVRALAFPTATALPAMLVVSPLDENTVFVATSNEGAWRSIDGGFTWTRVADLPIVVNTIAFDPASPNVMYAGAGGFLPDTMFKSTNGGVNWTPAGVLPAAGLSSGGFPNSIVVDPTDSNVVYVMASSHLYRSTNAGATWQSLSMGGNPNLPLNSNLLLIDPLIPTTLFASASPGSRTISRSVDGGSTWELIPFTGGSEFTTLYRAVLDPARPNRVIANPSLLGLMTFEVSPDIEVELWGYGGPLGVGTTVNTALYVRNRGPFASSATEVRVTLPAWLTPEVPPGCTRAGATLTCRTGAIRVNDEVHIPLRVAVAATPATGIATASVEGHEPDSVTANNAVTVVASSSRYSNLSLSYIPTLPFRRTTTVHLLASVFNSGPDAAPSARAVFTVPAGLTAIAATSASGPCTIAGDTVTCTFAEIAVDARAHVDLELRGDVAAEFHNVIANVTSDAIDQFQPNHLSMEVRVRGNLDASVLMTESAGARVVGTPWTYLITARNDGPDAGDFMSALWLEGATITAVTGPAGAGCSFQSNQATCGVSGIAAGSQFQMTVTANATSTGSVRAEGFVNALTALEVNTANNTVILTATVSSPPSPPAPANGGGKKGGGGALDWLGLLLLLLISARLPISARR